MRRNDELFLHDGWQIACSLRNGKIEHRYLWGAMQDELLAMDDAWALRDHLNTVRNVIDMNGKAISHLEYNAFGKLVSSTGDRLPFRYTGKMFDDATNLQWNINRWYDADVGRWVSEDPIGFMGRDGNLFRYVSNMSNQKVDFLGFTEEFPSVDIPSDPGSWNWWHLFGLVSGDYARQYWRSGKRETVDWRNRCCKCLYAVAFRADIYYSSWTMGWYSWLSIYQWDAKFQCYAVNTDLSVGDVCGGNVSGEDSGYDQQYSWANPGVNNDDSVLSQIGSLSSIVGLILLLLKKGKQ